MVPSISTVSNKNIIKESPTQPTSVFETPIFIPTERATPKYQKLTLTLSGIETQVVNQILSSKHPPQSIRMRELFLLTNPKRLSPLFFDSRPNLQERAKTLERKEWENKTLNLYVNSGRVNSEVYTWLNKSIQVS